MTAQKNLCLKIDVFDDGRVEGGHGNWKTWKRFSSFEEIERVAKLQAFQ